MEFSQEDIAYIEDYLKRMELVDKFVLLLRKRIANSQPWIDVRLKDFNLIRVLDRKQFRLEVRRLHHLIVNPLANSVPRSFAFSKPDEELSYREIILEYLDYFYQKGMSRDQIIAMMQENQVIVSRGKKR